ncbi:MAG: hypothetical protein SGBAC_003104 [Bacillariaceae sp.]
MVAPYSENDDRETINNRPLTLSSLESTNLLLSPSPRMEIQTNNQAHVHHGINFRPVPPSVSSRTGTGTAAAATDTATQTQTQTTTPQALDFETRLNSIRSLKQRSEADFETTSSCCSAVQTLQKQEKALESLFDSFQESSPKRKTEVEDDNDLYDEDFISLQDSLLQLQSELSAVDMIIPQLGSKTSGITEDGEERRVLENSKQVRVSAPLHESLADENYSDSSMDDIRVPSESPSFDENRSETMEDGARCPPSCTSSRVPLQGFFWGIGNEMTNDEIPPLSPCSSYLECNPNYHPTNRIQQSSNDENVREESLLTKAMGNDSSQGLRRPHGATTTTTTATATATIRKLDPKSKQAQAESTTLSKSTTDLHQDLVSIASRCSSKLQATLELGKKLDEQLDNAAGLGSYLKESSKKMTRVKLSPSILFYTPTRSLSSSSQHSGSFDKFENHQNHENSVREQVQQMQQHLSTTNQQQSTNPFDNSLETEDEEQDIGMRYNVPPSTTSKLTADSSIIGPKGDRYLPKKLQTLASPLPRVNKAGRANSNETFTPDSGLQVSIIEKLNENDPNRPLHSMLNRGQLKFDFEMNTGDDDVPQSTITSLELNPLDSGRKSIKGRDRGTDLTKTSPIRHRQKNPLNGFKPDISSPVLLGPPNGRQEQSSRSSASSSPQKSEVILEEPDIQDSNSFSISILDNVENCIELVCGDLAHQSPLACMREPLKTGTHSKYKPLATTKNADGHSGFAFGEEKGATSPKRSRYRKVVGKMLSPKKESAKWDTISRSEEDSFNLKTFETDVQPFSISGSWDDQENGNDVNAGDLVKPSSATLLSTRRLEEEVIQRNRLLLDALVGVNHASYRVLTTNDLLGVDTFGRVVQGNSIPDCYPENTILRKATMSSPIVRCLGKGMATIAYLRIDEFRYGVNTESRKLMETRVWKKEKQVWVNCQFHQTAVSSN